MLKYRLAEDVKVRDEEFGLLFYLCRSTQLVFIASENLLKATDLRQGVTATAATEKLLNQLVQRGLLHAEG